MATAAIPAGVVYFSGGPDIGWGMDGPLVLLPALAGTVLILVGISLFVWTVSMFATIGRGTLAPWDPTRRLVVRGVYRHVRNPMISGVASILFGEAVLLGSLSLLGWFLLFSLANAVFIPLLEERDLERRFGEEYRSYKRSVPRWIPRVRAWSPPQGDIASHPQASPARLPPP